MTNTIFYVLTHYTQCTLSYVIRSKTRKPCPKDTAIGVKLLRNLCYPDMKRFSVTPQDIGNCLYLFAPLYYRISILLS